MNPMLENLLADLDSGQDITDVAREYLGEISGHFDNDPVADFGPEAVGQIARLCLHLIDAEQGTDETHQI